MGNMKRVSWAAVSALFVFLFLTAAGSAQDSRSKELAEKFWSADIQEIDLDVAYQAAVAYEVDSVKTTEKLRSLTYDQNARIYEFVWPDKRPDKFNSLSPESLESLVNLFGDIVGVPYYHCPLNSDYCSPVPSYF